MVIERVFRVLRSAMIPTLLLALPAGAAAQDVAGPAKPAGTCVAVMAATVTGAEGNAAVAGTALRDLLVSFLTGPSMEPVALEARVRPLAMEEARQKGCAFIVTSTAARKRGSTRELGRVIGNAAGNAAYYLPGGSGAAAVGRAVSAGTARALGDIAATTRSKDEMRLEWTVTALHPERKGAPTRSEKVKASADGEDLLTPLVQRAAESIVETILK